MVDPTHMHEYFPDGKVQEKLSLFNFFQSFGKTKSAQGLYQSLPLVKEGNGKNYFWNFVPTSYM